MVSDLNPWVGVILLFGIIITVDNKYRNLFLETKYYNKNLKYVSLALWKAVGRDWEKCWGEEIGKYYKEAGKIVRNLP